MVAGSKINFQTGKQSMTKTGHQHPKADIFYNLDVVEFMILTVQLQVKHTHYLKRESN